LLREALVQLIRERGWDDVSVQDVCERADVGRSTFYVHFADKEELLVTGFDDLREILRAHLEPAKEEPLGFAAALFEHARDYKELYRALVGRRTAVAVQQGFLSVVKELVADDLVRAGMPPNAVPEVAVSYVAGAFWHVLAWWLEQRSPLPVGDIAAIFKRMTLPVLRVIQQGVIQQGVIQQGVIQQGVIQQGVIQQGVIQQGVIPQANARAGTARSEPARRASSKR
jgi:AcrR family transcriptional regulator